MRLTIRVLGVDLLDVSLETDPPIDYDEPGDCTAVAFGFAPSYPDQRYELGADLKGAE